MVLDGGSRTALGVVRSLGRLGIPIMVGSNDPLGRSGFSRYATRRFTYPPAKAELEATHQVIIDHVRAWRPDVLMPIYDEGWFVVYAFFEEYARLTTIVPCPNRNLSENVADKGRLAEYAEQHGVPIPKTFQPRSRDEAMALRDQLPYPVLLKPRKSVAGIGIRCVNKGEELNWALTQTKDIPLIQERIDGEDLELTILCLRGKAIAGSAYKSLRNAPLPFGPPVACRSIKNEALMHTGIDFLKKLQYHGVAHLDFRMDHRDGQPKLLEFNPRLAGTNEISTRTGIDFALMLYRLAIGERVKPCFSYETGREFRWLGELRHLIQTPYKCQTVRELLRWHRVNTEIYLMDLMPHVVMLIKGLMQLHRRGKTKNAKPQRVP